MKSLDIIVGRISGFGGVENVIDDWFINLKNEFNIRLVLPIDTLNTDWLQNKKVYRNKIRFNKRIFIYSSGMLFTIKYLLTTDTEYLVIENYRIVLIASIIKKIFRKKYVIVSWMHQSLHIKKNMANCLKYADYHFAIASGIKDQLIEVGVDRRKIFLIYNPVEKVKQKIKFERNKLKLVYIGRAMLDGQKNLRELLGALAKLNENFTLTMYGVSSDDIEIVKYIEKLNLGDRIILRGWVRNPWREISSATCLVLTSKYEGFGLVLLESIARGLPVLSSDVRVGSNDIVKNGVNGYLYESGNITELLTKLQLISDNGEIFNSSIIKNSIERFYVENYYQYLKSVFDKLNKNG
ncbi:MAG: glycosyltransferase [Liquorilactobacillus hordei]|uniref:glycosyltransferase n=1 Tax=Liquorilactobacillus hordei TaxID=468911 RepID=UPI0039ED2A09